MGRLIELKVVKRHFRFRFSKSCAQKFKDNEELDFEKLFLPKFQLFFLNLPPRRAIISILREKKNYY